MARWMARRNKTSADGVPVFALGIRVGYWPCLRAPFVQLACGWWHVEVWHGYASKHQLEKGDA